MSRLCWFPASARQGRGAGPRLRSLIVVFVAAFLLDSRSAFACPMCFGAKETGLIDGAKLGVLALLLVLLVVQGAFVAFFIYLRNRAKQTADIDLDVEWLELQRGSTTT